MTTRAASNEDIFAFHIPSEVQLASDGSWALWTQRQVDEELQKTVSGLRRVALPQAGEEAPGTDVAVLTDGPYVDHSARISPGGDRIAFVRSQLAKDLKNPPTQLCIMPATGGDVRVLVAERGGFGPPSWSPDGRQLVVSLRRADPIVEGRDAPLSIRVTRLYYKIDGQGFLPKDRHRLYLVATDTDEAGLTPLQTSSTPAAECDWDEVSPTWSPDGRHIAFLANRRDARDFDIENQDAFVVSASGGQAIQCTQQRGALSALTWAPNSAWLTAYACPTKLGHVLAVDNTHLFRVSPAGSEPEVDLTPALDRCTQHLTLDDVWGLDAMGLGPAIAADGRSIYTMVSDCGTTYLGRLAVTESGLADGTIEPVFDHAVVMGYALAAGRIAVVTSAPTRFACIEVCRDDGSERQLAAWPMAAYCQQVALAEPIEMTVPSAAGHDLQAWLMLPPDADVNSDRTYPLLLSIHGGPVLQYGRTYLHEIQTLAARGYAVLYANPRGSQGYGKDFVSAGYRNWGDPAYEDLMAVLDHALAEYPLDAERMGVFGGSYGGYMTSWIIGNTNRFKVACTQRTVSYVDALEWSDYGGWMRGEFGASPQQDPEFYRKMSPMRFVERMDTPLLIMQGLSDMRTTSDQGERLYVAMRGLGKEVELALFPGANHDLSRNGPPAQRVERLRILHEWFDRYLR